MLTPVIFAGLIATGAPADFVDPRDGQVYPLVEFADTVWFGRHLAYAAPESWCFDDDPAECTLRGRLYRWPTAKTACPAGTHLSTEAEWQALERHLGMPPDELERERLRGTEAGVGDRLKRGGDSGLAIELAGWRRPDGSYAAGNGEDTAAALWTADAAGEGTAWHRDVSSARSGVWRSPVDEPYALAVRCVVDPTDA